MRMLPRICTHCCCRCVFRDVSLLIVFCFLILFPPVWWLFLPRAADNEWMDQELQGIIESALKNENDVSGVRARVQSEMMASQGDGSLPASLGRVGAAEC